jgi:hypothetical protein
LRHSQEALARWKADPEYKCAPDHMFAGEITYTWWILYSSYVAQLSTLGDWSGTGGLTMSTER